MTDPIAETDGQGDEVPISVGLAAEETDSVRAGGDIYKDAKMPADDVSGDESVGSLADAYARQLERGRGADDSTAARLDRAAPGLVACLQRLDRHGRVRVADDSAIVDISQGQASFPGDRSEVITRMDPCEATGTDSSLPREPAAGDLNLPAVGRFVLERELGRGGFGVVFLCVTRHSNGMLR